LAKSLQLHNSQIGCARELYKPSKNTVSLPVCNEKSLRFPFCFLYDVTSEMFLAFFTQVTWPWAQPLDGSILLKFSLETRLKSESFGPLIRFPAFLVQKLWSIKHKNDNDNFTKKWQFHPNSATRNARKPIKSSKDSDCSLFSNKNFSEIFPSSSWAQG